MGQPARLSDRFGGGLHRRRFVQDGDIPVTVLRRDQGHEVAPHRGVAAAPPPTSSRLQRTEAALAAETAAREKAERSLSETQSVVRDLQTKIGHAELAKNEAVDTLRREREAITLLRAEREAVEERLQDALEQVRAAERTVHACQEELAEERHARKNAEKALRIAESARDAAEQLVRTLSEEIPAPRQAAQPAPRPRVVAERDVAVVPVRRGRVPETVAAEPEPVKWWLNTKPTGKKR
jgi:septal ring factor EnvC (AmiA/AmiB activator)